MLFYIEDWKMSHYRPQDIWIYVTGSASIFLPEVLLCCTAGELTLQLHFSEPGFDIKSNQVWEESQEASPPSKFPSLLFLLISHGKGKWLELSLFSPQVADGEGTVQFDGDSYAMVSRPIRWNPNISTVMFKFRTFSSNALLMYLATDDLVRRTDWYPHSWQVSCHFHSVWIYRYYENK